MAGDKKLGDTGFPVIAQYYSGLWISWREQQSLGLSPITLFSSAEAHTEKTGSDQSQAGWLRNGGGWGGVGVNTVQHITRLSADRRIHVTVVGTD